MIREISAGTGCHSSAGRPWAGTCGESLLSCRRLMLGVPQHPEADMSQDSGGERGVLAGKRRVSRLCQPLLNCLHSDQSPLSVLEYLIQFMAARDALHLLQFWFSVTSFRNAAPTSLTDSNRPLCTSPPHPNSLGSGDDSRLRDHKCPASVVTECVRETTKTEHSPHTLASPVNCGGTTVVLGAEQWSEVGGGDRSDGVGGASCEYGVGNGEVVATDWTHTSGTKPADITRQPSLNVVSDAVGIYSTYIALNALAPVHIPDDIRQRVEVDICPEDGIVNRTCFDEAQEYVYGIIEKRYYPQFLRSSYLCKFQLELVSSGQLCLLDFLLGGDSLGYFTEFMEAEAALPLLQFWLTAESFRENVTTAFNNCGKQCSSEENLEDAISIYERYFSLQATHPLGMGDEVRVEIESRICDERGPRPDSYLPTQLLAYDTMNEKFYPHFLESGPYLKFLHCLLAVVKSTPEDQEPDKPTLNSRAGPSSAQSETETLPWFPAYDVDDPESLWTRPHFLMRLGCVDGMGQYWSEIDPFPTKRNKSKLEDQAKHFRQFKNRQEEEEWEYAVKVSKTIVAKILKRTSRTSF